jgi:rfaE bifunctional protein nucleotidyltransferase chain/domain
VRYLEAARRLGDCLVVALNSDAGVRRLKGHGRPIVPQADRERVLRALACVDAVVVFDEPTPAAVLERVRPDVFAKGGDYTGRHIEESDVMAAWGGAVVALPYLDGRSTTRLVETLEHLTERQTDRAHGNGNGNGNGKDDGEGHGGAAAPGARQRQRQRQRQR